MASHPPVRGSPAVANRWLLTNVLRQEWSPQGTNVTVASDNSDVSAMLDYGVASTPRGAADLALTAGLDQELKSGVTSFSLPQVANLTAGGGRPPRQAVSRAVERAVRNTLRLKFASGLFDRPAVVRSSSATDPAKTASDHARRVALARDAARQGIVLLVNKRSALPDVNLLSAGRRVAVVGPLGDGLDAQQSMLGGYAPKDVSAVATLAAALRAAAGDGPAAAKVSFAAGATPCNNSVPTGPMDGQAAAVALAAASDVAFVVVGDSGGVDCDTCGEGRDRTSLELPGSQLPLLRAVLNGVTHAKTKVVIVLVHGRPVTFGAAKECARLDECHNDDVLGHPALSSVVAAWRPGQEGGGALVDLVTGAAPFVGKLTQAWPRSVGQIGAAGVGPWFGLPLRQGTTLTGDAYAEGLKTPLFPFAHGLQPGTDFVFSDLKLSRDTVTAASAMAAFGAAEVVNVTVRVTNNGAVSSAATVQVYFSPPLAPYGAMRFARRLAGFERVWVRAGEAVEVTVGVKVGEELMRYDEWCALWGGEDGEEEKEEEEEERGEKGDESCKPGWTLDKGVYGFYVGDCCVNGVTDDSATCSNQERATLAVV